jgi:DNA-binding Lrp family transcriptional regulator
MDYIDKKIIEILRKNSRTAITKIAENVGLTEGAVRYRIKEMLKSGVIKRFTIDTREKVDAIVLIKTEANVPTEKISEIIKKIPDVIDVYEVSGDYDIICMIERGSVGDVNETIEKIRKVRGVLETLTCMILRKS